MADPADRFTAFARGLALAHNLSIHDTARLYARVERVTRGYRRGGEWRAEAHLTGANVRRFDVLGASTTDGDAGVYAHGPTADAAVDAAIAEWRRAMREHAARAERESVEAAKSAARWRAIVAAIGDPRG